MTFIGKTLVVVLTAFSIIFLAVSTAVKLTGPDWKVVAKARKDQLGKLKTEQDTLENDATVRTKELANAKASRQASAGALKARITELSSENQRRQEEIAALRKNIEEAQQKAKVALTETQDQTKVLNETREQLAAVKAQADAFQARADELTDELTLLQRARDVAVANNQDLRQRLGAGAATSAAGPSAPAPGGR